MTMCVMNRKSRLPSNTGEQKVANVVACSGLRDLFSCAQSVFFEKLYCPPHLWDRISSCGKASSDSIVCLSLCYDAAADCIGMVAVAASFVDTQISLAGPLPTVPSREGYMKS